jgi:hypothetical protein
MGLVAVMFALPLRMYGLGGRYVRSSIAGCLRRVKLNFCFETLSFIPLARKDVRRRESGKKREQQTDAPADDLRARVRVPQQAAGDARRRRAAAE